MQVRKRQVRAQRLAAVVTSTAPGPPAWVWVPAPWFTNWMSSESYCGFGASVSLSENGKSSTHLIVFCFSWGLNELIPIWYLEKCLSHSKFYMNISKNKQHQQQNKNKSKTTTIKPTQKPIAPKIVEGWMKVVAVKVEQDIKLKMGCPPSVLC